MSNTENQKTKIIMTSPIGEVLELKTFDSVGISQSFDSKVSTFSLKTEVFNETELKKFGVGTEVKIYSAEQGKNLDNHLIYKGIVQENPKSLDTIVKSYDFSGADTLSLTQNRIVNESYENIKMSDIVNDLITKYALDIYTIDYIQPVDYTITIKFKDVFLYSALERLSEAIGFTFKVDLNDKFSFYESSSKTSNRVLRMGDYSRASASFSYDSSRLVNKLTVYGGKSLSPDITQKIKGDGLNSTYLINYKPRASSSGSIKVLLNGVSQKVGIAGLTEDGVDCIINYHEKNIKFVNSADSSDKILTSTDTAEITYRYESSLITKLDDKASVEKYGIKEDIVRFADITDKIALTDRAKAHLRKYSSPIITGSLSTWLNLWECGEITKIEIETEEGFFMNEWLQITDKSINLTPNQIKIGLKFEQKKILHNVLKNILERLGELEKDDENETVQQLDIINDKIAIQGLFIVHTSKGSGFKIGSSKLGGLL